MEDDYEISIDNDNIGVSFREFYKKEYPFKIGGLEKEAFSYLGDWKLFMFKNGYGVAHRLGIKMGLVDQEGDPIVLFLHFAVPLAKKGNKTDQKMVDEQLKGLRKMMKEFTVRASNDVSCSNAVSINPTPPEYMLKELKEKFGLGTRLK